MLAYMDRTSTPKHQAANPGPSRLPSLDDVSSPNFARELTDGFRKAVSTAVERQHAAGIEVHQVVDGCVEIVPPPKAACKTR